MAAIPRSQGTAAAWRVGRPAWYKQPVSVCSGIKTDRARFLGLVLDESVPDGGVTFALLAVGLVGCLLHQGQQHKTLPRDGDAGLLLAGPFVT